MVLPGPSCRSRCSCTGAPRRVDAGGRTGRGVYYGLREACANVDDMRHLGLSTGLEGKAVAVQGFGNVGYHAARFLQEGGAVVVGVAEHDGAVHDPEGLDVEALAHHGGRLHPTRDLPVRGRALPGRSSCACG